MAVYSTEENQKDEMLRRTIHSLMDTVDFKKHRLILSVNGYTAKTKQILNWAGVSKIVSKVIWCKENIGTAEAINLAWRERHPGENVVKMDDDVVIHQPNWLYYMEEAIARHPQIGQIGLKRRDLMEHPEAEGPYKSILKFLPHKSGEIWIPIEYVKHVMGTCVMHSSALIDAVGYLYQPGLYGFDDSLMSLRSHLAGYLNAFLPGIDIEHIDSGATPYQGWKEQHAGEKMAVYNEIARDYKSGKLSLKYNPYGQS